MLLTINCYAIEEAVSICGISVQQLENHRLIRAGSYTGQENNPALLASYEIEQGLALIPSIQSI